MLVGNETERRDIPHEPGQWFEFGKLSGNELDEASRKATQRSLALVGQMTASVIAMATGREASEVDEMDQRRASYDTATLVTYGVMAWSYDPPCDAEAIGRLDALTRDWARDVVLEMNMRTDLEKKGLRPESPVASSRQNSEQPTSSA